jgi:AcrR family transcriptional regulator
MPRAVKKNVDKRAYDATRRQEQARANRLAILDAGRRIFLERGYGLTTMPAVAAAAGVSTETVYKAFTNKPGLVKAIFDVAIVGDDEPIPLLAREFVQRNMAEPDPVRKLITYGEHLAELSPRTSPILLVVREAAGADKGAATVWERVQNERLAGMTAFARHLHAGGHLRTDVDEAEARDVLWVHNSVELWDLLVRQRSWDYSRFGQWIGKQLVSALL